MSLSQFCRWPSLQLPQMSRSSSVKFHQSPIPIYHIAATTLLETRHWGLIHSLSLTLVSPSLSERGSGSPLGEVTAAGSTDRARMRLLGRKRRRKSLLLWRRRAPAGGSVTGRWSRRWWSPEYCSHSFSSGRRSSPSTPAPPSAPPSVCVILYYYYSSSFFFLIFLIWIWIFKSLIFYICVLYFYL